MTTDFEELEDEVRKTKKKPTRRYHSRGFLNPKVGLASIECEGTAVQDDSRGYIDGNVSIRDCSRQVTLEFYVPLYEESFFDDGTVDDRLYKLDVLIDELTSFRDWYTEQAEWANNPDAN